MPSQKPESGASESKESWTDSLPNYLKETEPLELEHIPIQVALLTGELVYLRRKLESAERTISWLVRRYDRYRADNGLPDPSRIVGTK
jgi:hypothetical protein